MQLEKNTKALFGTQEFYRISQETVQFSQESGNIPALQMGRFHQIMYTTTLQHLKIKNFGKIAGLGPLRVPNIAKRAKLTGCPQ